MARLLCVGDLFYDQLQLSHPQWCTPWDHDTVRAVRARRRLLDRVADEHLLVHAYHMPFPAWAESPGMAAPTAGNRYDTMTGSPLTSEGRQAQGNGP